MTFLLALSLAAAVAVSGYGFEEARPAWDAYVAETLASYGDIGMQDSCKPALYEDNTKVPYRGTILLLHGFTACPQQWHLIIPELTSQGYTVLTPTLPGHGANYEVQFVTSKNGSFFCRSCETEIVGKEIIDHFEFIPDDPEVYAEFCQRMNGIMALADGVRVLGGLSLGASHTLYMGSHAPSMAEKPFTYDRHLAMSPYLQVAGIGDPAMLAINALPLLRDIVRKGGDACELQRTGGRGGVCNYAYKYAAAARNFGAQVLENATTAEPSVEAGKIQFTFNIPDKVVENEATRTIYSMLGAGKTSEHACAFDQGLPHAFISEWDKPWVVKFWLAEIVQTITAYLVEGTAFVQNGTTTEEDNWKRCQLVCTNTTCTFDRKTQTKNLLSHTRARHTLSAAAEHASHARKMLADQADQVPLFVPAGKRIDALQNGCEPRVVEAAAGGPAYQGTAVLFHDHSACPAQMLPLADLLSKAGYRVLLPLLPGHGRSPLGVGAAENDVLDGVPSLTVNPKGYHTFAGLVNAKVLEYEKPYFVGGLGLGAILSQLATQLGEPGQYARQVLLAPMYALVDNETAATILRLATEGDGGDGSEATNFKEAIIPWGQRCVGARREGGAPGYCEFKMSQAALAWQLSFQLQEKFGDPGWKHPPTQVVGAEGDADADAGLLRSAITKLSDHANVSSCFLGANIGHEVLADKDNLGVLVPFRDELRFELNRFLTSGTALTTTGTDTCSPAPFPSALSCGAGTEELEGQCAAKAALSCGAGTEELEGKCVVKAATVSAASPIPTASLFVVAATGLWRQLFALSGL